MDLAKFWHIWYFKKGNSHFFLFPYMSILNGYTTWRLQENRREFCWITVSIAGKGRALCLAGPSLLHHLIVHLLQWCGALYKYVTGYRIVQLCNRVTHCTMQGANFDSRWLHLSPQLRLTKPQCGCVQCTECSLSGSVSGLLFDLICL